MATPNQNLKAVVEHFGLTNIELARALDFEPSLVSRYLSGHRELRASSAQMDAIADFILTKSERLADIEWLKEQFEAAGLPTELTTVYRFKQNLVMWLATDGKTLRKNLGATLPGDMGGKQTESPKESTTPKRPQSAVHVGTLSLVLSLRSALLKLPCGAVVDVFLSNDQLTTTVNEDFAALLLEMAEQNDLRFRMVVCVSGNTRFMSRLLNTYMGALVSGHVQLSVVHGMTQTVTNQLHILLPSECAVLVTETTGTAAPSIAAFVAEPRFAAETKRSFDTTARYAQPILNIYGDDYSRNILETLYMEFCTPGALDVIKDSLNPMYMTPEGYDRFLQTRGHSDEEYAWRSAEYLRFKSGLDHTLSGGSVFREILSLSRLRDIAETGTCRMAGLYFMQSGYIHLNAEGCMDILNGYIRYLERTPNFHLLIVDDFGELHENNCWQLKQNHHLAVNCWSGTEPVMIHSDQLMLLREFQEHFDKLWEQGQKSIGSRAGVIAILQDVAARLKSNQSY